MKRPLIGAAVLLSVATVSANAGFLVIRTEGGVIAVDTQDGQVVAQYDMPDPLLGEDVLGIEWRPPSYLLSVKNAYAVWEADSLLDDAQFLVDTPRPGKPEGIALHGGLLFVNAQQSSPPDSMYAIDPLTGDVQLRSAMPVTNLKDITSDGTWIWGVNSSPREVWRIDPADGSFDQSIIPPAGTFFAIAWDPAEGMLWLIDYITKQGLTLNPSTEEWTPRFTISTPSFPLAAVYRDAVTPIDIQSWGEIKQHFRRTR
jgi:hypothetical protein